MLGVFFDFLSFTLDQKPKQLQFEKKSLPITPSQPQSPALPSLPASRWVEGLLLDGVAFDTFGNFLHKRFLRCFKTDFDFFVCIRALTGTTALAVLAAGEWPSTKGSAGSERGAIVSLYSMGVAPLK